MTDATMTERRAAEEARMVGYGLAPTPGMSPAPEPVRPGAAGVIAVPEAAAPELRTPGLPAVPLIHTASRINGAEVLEQGYGFLAHMAHWDNPWVPLAAALIPATAHARDPKTRKLVWLTQPRVFFTGEDGNIEGGEGKSRKARCTAWLCPDPERVTEMSKAYLISQMAMGKTVIVTELDNVVGPSGRRNPWLPGLVNAGFEEDGKTGNQQDRQAAEKPLFGTFILDGKAFIMYTAGPNLGPMWSRSLIFRSKTAPEGYSAPRFTREMKAHAVALRGRYARWMAQEVADGIADHEPEIPEGLGNRPLDLWWNVFCCAERAGGPWPALMREACRRSESAAGLPEQDAADAATIAARQRKWGIKLPALPGAATDDGLED